MTINRYVDFLICGTQKGGTSALFNYLKEHPEICMADRKEVHFFDDESHFVNKNPDYSKYHLSFSPKHESQLVGEATPIYMYWHDAPRRIWEYNPNIKLIVLLRNPIERAYSHWNMERFRGADNLPFWDAIINEKERCRAELPLQHRVYSYIDRGFYLEQLRRLWMYFPIHQVMALKHEHLQNQPSNALRQICEFLGVAPFQSVETKNVHSTPYITTITETEKAYLLREYEYEIQGIARVLGWDCSHWLVG
jgi:hypothetical protein